MLDYFFPASYTLGFKFNAKMVEDIFSLSVELYIKVRRIEKMLTFYLLAILTFVRFLFNVVVFERTINAAGFNYRCL